MPPTIPAVPIHCPAIGDPVWHLPPPAEALGSWLLLVVLALAALAAVRWLLAPLPTWRARIAVAIMYGVAVVALLGAVLLLALVVPAFQSAAEREFWSFQPTASPTALGCARIFLGLAHHVWTNFEQGAEILLAIALLAGGGALWLRARWRDRRPVPAPAAASLRLD